MKPKDNVAALRLQGEDGSKMDVLKWILALAILLASLVANYYYSDYSLSLRMLVSLLVFGVMGLILSQTKTGKQALEFFKESRVELRKVVWPTREETVQTTMIVAVMVVVLALLLWGMDGILVWAIGWLTGQRG